MTVSSGALLRLPRQKCVRAVEGERGLGHLQPGAHVRLFSRQRTLSARILTDVSGGSDLRSLLRRHLTSVRILTEAFSIEKINVCGLGVPTGLGAAQTL